MSLLTLPIELPARVVRRAFEDLGTIATTAREVPERLDALNARADRIQDQLDRTLTLGETIAENTTAMVSLAERIESRGESMIELGERMIELGNAVMSQSDLLAARAQEVADRGAEVVSALPILERAVSLATPMEGAVERLGRAIDRLPGGRPRPAPEEQGADEG